MFEFSYTLSDGRRVSIVNQLGTSWGYDVYDSEGNDLGTIWTDGEDGTESATLKPFEAELLEAIYAHQKPDL